jgi:hypothetical protein
MMDGSIISSKFWRPLVVERVSGGVQLNSSFLYAMLGNFHCC